MIIRWLLIIFICIALGIGLYDVIQRDAGYVLVSLGGRTFETSFWFAVLAIVFSFLVLYTVWRIVKKLLSIVFRSAHWFSDTRSRSIEKRYRDGLLLFLTGNYRQANKQLAGVAKHQALPVVRAITHAKSLAAEADFDTALKVLAEAERRYPQDRAWLYKAQIPLLIEQNQFDGADSLLSELKLLTPDDEAVARLEHLNLSRAKNWQGASHFLADKRVSKQLGTSDQIQTYENALNQLLHTVTKTAEDVNALWASVPKKLKLESTLIIPYAQLLFETEQHSLLEELIIFTLDSQWLEPLVDLYAKTNSSDVSSQLKKAERWLSTHKDSRALKLTLGVLALKNQLWGKAKAYFEDANSSGDDARATYFLGFLSEKMGHSDEANVFYKRAAELSHTA